MIPIDALPPASSRAAFSLRAMTLFGVITAASFSAASSAPTPLYRHYQDAMGLSPAILTMIFAAYVLSLLTALLTVGSLSDYVGRRPVIFVALALNALAMLMFVEAGSGFALTMARIVQGFATGMATTGLGAVILDSNRSRGPLLNSITAFSGLTLGALGSGALVTFAPAPTELIYLVLLAISALEAVILWWMPETAQRKPGAFASLRPQVSVPPQARQALLRLTPVNIAAWALGGFYFSLMPSLIRVATGLTSPLIGGIVVAALTSSGALAVVLMRNRPASHLLALGTSGLALGVAITLAGVDAELAALMLLGTIVAGFGFGAAFSGTIRTVLPLAPAGARAGLLSAFYVESYLAFSLPAIAAGLAAPALGLPLATYIYGTAIILLAMISFAARNVSTSPARAPTCRVPSASSCA